MRLKQTRQKANPTVFNITLQLWLFDLTTDEALSVKDCVGRVGVEGWNTFLAESLILVSG